MLHVTNGESAVERIRAAGIAGDVLPWQDVLHDGPVPAGLPLEALSGVRADWIASRGWGDADAVRRDFAARDGRLAACAADDEVVLWFEHDLYDQLQLVQLLDWFAEHPHPRLRLINPAEYLGMMDAERMRALFAARAPVTDAQLALGQAAWDAFRAPDPRRMEALVQGDASALPHLGAALRRMLEEYPSVGDGLSRSGRQALRAFAGGSRVLRDAYPDAHHAVEDPIWLGDLGFAAIVDTLASGPAPLLEVEDSESPMERPARLTGDGRRVLDGAADAVAMDGIDRWIGGVHLRGRTVPWRWDPEAGRIVAG